MATTTKTKKMITLYSSDGEEFKIEESVAKRGRTNSKKHVDSSSSKVITYPKRTNSKKHEDSSSSKVNIFPYRSIVLCSSDGEEFVVGEMEAVLCEKIKHMFGDGCDGKVVPVPDVTGEVLSKVIEYLEKHVYEKTTDEELKAWDAEFVNVDRDMLFYVMALIAEKMPELLDFAKDLVHLEAASKIQLKLVAEEMQAVSKGLEKVEQELTASENDGAISVGFRKVLKSFLDSAEADVRSLISLYSEVGRNADSLAQYFGEDPARCPFEQVTSILVIFVNMFNKASDENARNAEAGKRKMEKEAMREKSESFCQIVSS